MPNTSSTAPTVNMTDVPTSIGTSMTLSAITISVMGRTAAQRFKYLLLEFGVHLTAVLSKWAALPRPIIYLYHYIEFAKHLSIRKHIQSVPFSVKIV